MSLDEIRELKDRIKNIPISQIIGNYISLSRKGKYWLGICPFHNDSNPSLQVNDDRGMFMCFVDNIGGDAITFVQKYKNLDFMDALKDICGVVGISWDEYVVPKNESSEMKMGRKVISRVQLIYEKFARKNAREKFNTFLQARGLNQETADEFGIGFAPGTNTITNYLESIPNQKERELAINVALDIGLILPDNRNRNNHYDTFRNRIMFPIMNGFGTHVAYSGRAIDDNQKPKYINSRESFLFKKKNILYGFHMAKSSIRNMDCVILVEGQMDVIALHQHGLKNSVAVMGIGFTENTLRNLKALSNNFYLALDSDQAGMQAMKRINGLCLENGIIPKFLDFSPYNDPDEFLQNSSVDDLRELMKKSSAFIDILIANELPDIVPEIPDQKLSALRKIFPIVAPLGDTLSATERLIENANQLGIKSDPGHIISFYNQFLKENKKVNIGASHGDKKEVKTIISPVQFHPTVKKPINNTEKLLIQELVRHPECLLDANLLKLLDYISSEEIKKYIFKLRDFICEIDEVEYTSIVLSITSTGDYSIGLKEIVGVALFKYEKTELNDSVVNRLIGDFSRKLCEDRLVEKRRELKELQGNCDTEKEAHALMQKITTVDRDLMELKKPQRNVK